MAAGTTPVNRGTVDEQAERVVTEHDAGVMRAWGFTAPVRTTAPPQAGTQGYEPESASPPDRNEWMAAVLAGVFLAVVVLALALAVRRWAVGAARW